MSVTQADIHRALPELGLEHSSVCIHASLRSFGPLIGGPRALVEAFLEAGCTLLVPTFSYETFAVAPPPNLQFANNGYDYSYRTSRPPRTQNVYTPQYTGIDEDMGALPAAVLAMPDHFRGDHPLNSFSAVGPNARKLVEKQHPTCVYAPLTVLSEAGGSVLLAGVGPSRMTLLHLAEQRAGRTPFRRWAQDREGNPLAAEVGGCSEGFERLAPVLAPYAQRTQIGASRWQVFQASEVVKVVAEAIRAEPDITHCDNPACERCHDAISGGPSLS